MQTLRQYISQELNGLYPDGEIRSFFYIILELMTGGSRAEILANKYTDFSETEIDAFKTIVSRLKNFEPLQYIIGETEFYNLSFKVNPAVLIPRPETEELVDWILKDTESSSELAVLDIGTGSGCIAISLAANLEDSKVTAIDVSEAALLTAKGNAELNNVTLNLELLNILEENSWDNVSGCFDVIVSNPPYVCEKEKLEMEPNVLKYEPFLALFVSDNNPLLFYQKIALFASEKLVSGGKLFFEINQAFGKEVIKLLEDLGYVEIELRKDIFERDRMIKAQKL